MKITESDAYTIRRANKVLEEKTKELDYYLQKSLKGDSMADIKHERAQKEIDKAQAYLDKICKKYNR